MRPPADSLLEIQAAGLLRRQRPLDSPTGSLVVRDGRQLWNFASNDYLGLARHPQIEAALIEGVHRYGAGAAASRLVCGTLPPHQLLENALALAKKTDAALTFSSGYATAMGCIPAIVGKADFIFLDKLCHACLVDAARLSGATLRVFPHNDLQKLERLLISTRAKSTTTRILVMTESVFSMDGDLCPLAEMVTLADHHDALLFLDEAHGFGVLGATGMGLAERENLQSRIPFQMGTLSKSAGLAGGYLAASREWIDLITNRARSFIYSTAPPPCLAHAALASLALIQSAEGSALRKILAQHTAVFSNSGTPIFPHILGSNEATLAAADQLEMAGFLVPAIRFPTVPRGAARLRISLSAAHGMGEVTALAAELAKIPLKF